MIAHTIVLTNNSFLLKLRITLSEKQSHRRYVNESRQKVILLTQVANED